MQCYYLEQEISILSCSNGGNVSKSKLLNGLFFPRKLGSPVTARKLELFHWNRLPIPGLEAFKARLGVALGSLICWLVTLHIAGGWNWMGIVVVFNPGHSRIHPMKPRTAARQALSNKQLECQQHQDTESHGISPETRGPVPYENHYIKQHISSEDTH